MLRSGTHPPRGDGSLHVIICTRDRPHLPPHSLRALREQTDRCFELVVMEALRRVVRIFGYPLAQRGGRRAARRAC